MSKPPARVLLIALMLCFLITSALAQQKASSYLSNNEANKVKSISTLSQESILSKSTGYENSLQGLRHPFTLNPKTGKFDLIRKANFADHEPVNNGLSRLLIEGSLELTEIHLSGPSFDGEKITDLIRLDAGLAEVINIYAAGMKHKASADIAEESGAYRSLAASMQSDSYFSIQFGLKYIGRGVKESQDNFSTKTLINYLALPIYGLYNFSSMSDGHFFAGLGPYIAYAINGKYKEDDNGTTTTTDVVFGKNGGVKRFDFGLNFLVGYDFNKFMIMAGYDLGLVNLNYDDVDKAHAGSIKLEFAYVIPTGSKK